MMGRERERKGKGRGRGEMNAGCLFGWLGDRGVV